MSKSKTPRAPGLTLRESYERKLMLERIRLADERLLAEHHARILLEAIDKDELAKATKILGKLQTIKAAADKDPQLKVLSDAIKEASDEVNDFTGGGIKSMLKRGLGSLAKKFGMEASANPILKSLTLLNSLETGFAQMVSLIKNSIPDYKPDEALTKQADAKGLKNLTKSIKKAFRPEGVFAKIKSLFGSAGGMPYVSDVEGLVKGIMSTEKGVLADVISAATEGGSTSSEAGEAAQDIAQTAGSGRQVSRPVKDTEDLAKTIATADAKKKGNDAESASASAEDNPKKVTQQFVDYVSKKSGQSPDVVNKVVSALIKTGKLKSEFKVAESANISGGTILTLREVEDARSLYLESGGSSRRWIDLLCEEKIDLTKADAGDVKNLKDFFEKRGIDLSSDEGMKNAVYSVRQKFEIGEKKLDNTDEELSKFFREKIAGKVEDKKIKPSNSEKHAKTVAAIKDSLSDIEPAAIVAILDTLPDYLVTESARRRKLLESKRRS